MNDTISVIIPVYNVAAYLRQCLDSVLSQSHPYLEVIVIDDGSTDHSGAICDEYAALDSRIIVIHQKNGGAAAAKNAGLRIATGKYLSFVDSDDYLEPNAYSHMLQLLHTYGADVVQCAYRDVFQNTSIDRLLANAGETFDVRSYLRLYTVDWTCGLMTDKLFVRALYDGIFFEEGHKIDDEYFTYCGIMNARKIVCDNFIIYNYRKRRSSVMYSPESGLQILKDKIDYLSKRRININQRFPDLRQAFDRHFLDMMIILSQDPASTKETHRLIRKQLLLYLKEKHHTPVGLRLWPVLLRIFLGLLKPKGTSQTELLQNAYFD